MRRSWTVIAIAALLAGCGGGSSDDGEQPAEATPNMVQPGAPGEPSRKIGPEEAARASSKPTEADIEFMQGMIHHHGQAVLMTGWVPDRTDDRRIRLLAQRMGLAQQDEIALMERWLEANGAAPDEHAGHELMPGMLTQAQLDRLKAADGREFERLFLRYMTRHHQGALTMVRELREAGGGLQSEVDAFARDVEADQQIEITRMRDLLAEVA